MYISSGTGMEYIYIKYLHVIEYPIFIQTWFVTENYMKFLEEFWKYHIFRQELEDL